MSYQVIIKTIKNHDYGYLYMSYYDKSTKQSKKKFIKYLGRTHSKKVQDTIAELRAGKREFFKRKSIKRKRAPEINLEDIRELSPWEKIFLATAIVVQEKAGEVFLDDVHELAAEYCRKIKIKPPAAWDQTVDYFKMLGWIEVRGNKLRPLLTQKQIGKVKEIILQDATL